MLFAIPLVIFCTASPGLETAALKSVSLLTFFALTLPSPGRVEEEMINKISPHLTPKIPPLKIMDPTRIFRQGPSVPKLLTNGFVWLRCPQKQFDHIKAIRPTAIEIIELHRSPQGKRESSNVATSFSWFRPAPFTSYIQRNSPCPARARFPDIRIARGALGSSWLSVCLAPFPIHSCSCNYFSTHFSPLLIFQKEKEPKCAELSLGEVMKTYFKLATLMNEGTYARE